MSGQLASRSGPETWAYGHPLARPGDADAGPHGLLRHDDPICACGRPREQCLAGIVRDLWAVSPSA